jgi:hypothetical protein
MPVVKLKTRDDSGNTETSPRNLGSSAAPWQKLPSERAKSSDPLPLR